MVKSGFEPNGSIFHLGRHSGSKASYYDVLLIVQIAVYSSGVTFLDNAKVETRFLTDIIVIEKFYKLETTQVVLNKIH